MNSQNIKLNSQNIKLNSQNIAPNKQPQPVTDVVFVKQTLNILANLKQ